MNRRSPVRCAILASVIVASVAGCAEPLAPVPLPAGAREFVPEPVFRVWWEQMEICSGERATFGDVRWYVVSGEEPFHVQGVDYPVIGYWDPHGNRIVLLEYLPSQRAPLIRHEALHAILHRTDHPSLYFDERCGSVIGMPDSPD